MSKKSNRKSRNHRINKQRKARRVARQSKLGFETLESRQLLTAVTVNSLDDFPVDLTDNLITLRDAVHAANNDVAVSPGGPVGSGADTISFDPDLIGDTLTLSQGQLNISSPTTINGLGADRVNIVAGAGSRHFNVDDATGTQIAVQFNGLKLSGGNVTGDGGAIHSVENLTITDSVLSGNQASSYGGAVNSYYGTLNITGSTVTGNTAGYDGGGIRSYGGAATITNSTVSGNMARDGGGLFLYGTANIATSTFSGNTATTNGGGIENSLSALTVSNSTLSGNTAGSQGGGVHTNEGSSGINNSTLSGNTAPSGGGISAQGGGGTLTLNSSIVANGTGLGNDVFFDSIVLSGSFNVIGDGTNIGDLTNTITADPLLGPLADNGGPTQTHALLMGSPAIDAGDPSVVFNPAEFDQRGAPFVRVVNGRIDIGAFELPAETPSLVVDFASDTVDGFDHLTSLREAISFANSQAGADTITFSSLFDTSQTIGLTGGELAISDALTITGPGQALLTIDAQQNSRVLNFTASTGDLTLAGLTLTGGRTTGNFEGGGIRFNSNGTLTLTSSTVSGNSTTGSTADGGGIETAFGAVTLTNSTVSGNTSGGDGGGIYAFSGAVTLTGSTVSGNISDNDGGGIYARSGAVTLISSTISGNSTTGSAADGGGISASSGAVTLTDSTVSGNISTDDGGGIYAYTGAVTLTGSTVSGNTSADRGGGIYTDDSTVLILNSTITGNSAAGVGGGIGLLADNYTASERLTLRNSIVAGNTDNGTAPDVQAPGDPANDLAVEFSLIGNNTGSSLAEAQTADAAGNLIGGSIGGSIDPMLGPLADNGGPTQTHALLAGSPAIDAGNSTQPWDQRGPGFFRFVGPAHDIGAFEQQADRTFIVTTTEDEIDPADTNLFTFDSFDLSLREAISLSNLDPTTNDTILFASGSGGAFENGGLIRLTLGEIEITDTVTIDGSSAGGLVIVTGDANDDDITVDLTFSNGLFEITTPTEITDLVTSGVDLLDDNSRVFHITSSTAATTINGLTITGGRTTATNDSGGGILSAADLTLIDSNVSGNSAAGTAASGGGIASNGLLRIVDSTVSQNVASSNGGGIQAGAGLTTTVIGSALFGNSAASGFGGAIFGLPNSTLYVTNTTLAANSAANGSAIASVTGGSVLLTNSTVTGNISPDGSTIHGVSNNLTLANSVILGNILFTGSEIVLVGPATQTVTGPTIVGTNLLNVGSGSTSLGGSVFAVASNVFAETIDYINTNGDGVKQPFESATSDGVIAGNLFGNGGNVLTVALSANPSNPALDAGLEDRLSESVVSIDLNGDGDTSDSINTDARGGIRLIDQAAANNGPNVVDLGAYETALPSADFDSDGDVDGGDFLAWQRGFGKLIPVPTHPDGDADADADVDATDLSIWEQQFGQPALPMTVSAPSVAVSQLVVPQHGTPSLALPQSSRKTVSETVSLSVTAEIVPSPALVRGELVDLALAYSLRDQSDFVREAKTSLASRVNETVGNFELLRRYDDVTLPASTPQVTTRATQRDEESRDAVQPRHTWENAFDKVFAEEQISPKSLRTSPRTKT